MQVKVTQYDREDDFSTLVEVTYDEVFEVDRSDEHFFTIVHDDDGVTVEDLIRKTDIVGVVVEHGVDLIGPAKEARDNYRKALEEQERQQRVQASGLSLA